MQTELPKPTTKEQSTKSEILKTTKVVVEPNIDEKPKEPPLNKHSLRLATFNVENLFARYSFTQFKKKLKQPKGFTLNDVSGFKIWDDSTKQITAGAIREVNADVICLQEVESLPVLDKFVDTYLKDMGYTYRILIDAHDPRQIDVAVLSRYPFSRIMTNRHLKSKDGNKFLFPRDCLEVDIDVNGKILSLYVNHFTSLTKGRKETKPRREEQASKVVEIFEKRWKKLNFNGNFAVLGDLNDDSVGDTSLGALLNHPHLVNVTDRLPKDERWTHYCAKMDEYCQLDYIFLSKVLANNNPNAKPVIMRKGLPHRAKRYTGPRFENVDENHPKASDHAPVYIDINLV